jgi:hypothetical protein
MPKLGEWTVAVVIGVGLGCAALAAEPEPEDAPAPAKSPYPSKWSGHLLGSKEKPAVKQTPVTPDKEMVKELEAMPRTNVQAESATAQRAREESALLRRLAVCDQLKLMAVQNRDDRLMRQAEELDQRAREVYGHRIAHLPVGQAAGQVARAPVEYIVPAPKNVGKAKQEKP